MGQTPSAKGIFQVFQLDQRQQSRLKLLKEMVKGPGYKCGTFGASPMQQRAIAVGDFSGTLSIIDIQTSQDIFTVKAHDTIINSIQGAGNTGYGPSQIVTGSRDGSVRVWDPRQTTPVVSLEPAQDPKPDCWAVCFGNCYNNSQRMIAAGYDNGDIKLFDMRTNYLQWDSNVQNGVVGLQFDRRDSMMNKLAATTLQGRYHIFDLRTFNASEGGYAQFCDKLNDGTIWGVRHVHQNRDLFAILGGNGSLSIFKYHYPPQRAVQDLNGNPKGVPGTVELLNQKDISTQPIASFDWNDDKLGLAVLSCLDQTMKVIITTKLNLY